VTRAVASGVARPGTVYLAGAGPGDPGLLTVRTLHLLGSADLILHDDLVSDEILALAHADAELVSVGKRCGQPRMSQEETNALMVAGAQAGRSVLRLKSGDPLVFGRAGEEIAALRHAAVPFEIVPGITAAFAAAAALATPLTDRAGASMLVLATAHHAAGRESPLDGSRTDDEPGPWSGVRDATLVLYMPGRSLRRVADRLIADGFPPATPCVALSRISTAHEQRYATTLAGADDTQLGPAPVLLLIGEAIQPMLDLSR
jgi:uroporphyrin-III C-methyltransferase